jgi:hypothetical protein
MWAYWSLLRVQGHAVLSAPSGIAQLKAVYGSILGYIPASTTGGINPSPGYVAKYPDGHLVFWVTNYTVQGIAGGPRIVPSSEC